MKAERKNQAGVQAGTAALPTAKPQSTRSLTRDRDLRESLRALRRLNLERQLHSLWERHQPHVHPRSNDFSRSS
jgi:hypothetical protein